MSFISSIFGGGGGSKTQTIRNVTEIPPQTAAEKALTGIQVEAAGEQLEFGRELKEQFPELFAQLESDLTKLTEASERVSEELGAGAPNLAEATDAVFAQLQSGGQVTAEDIQNVGRAVSAAFDVGARDISAAAERQLKDVRDILAPSRGLRPGDAPIQDVGGRIGEEATRQTGQLARGLGAAGAQELIDLPLRRATTLSNIALGQQQLGLQVTGFQQDLRNAALENRLRLAALQSETSLSLAGLQPVGAATLSTLTSARTAQPTISGTSTVTDRPGFIDFLRAGASAGLAASRGFG